MKKMMEGIALYIHECASIPRDPTSVLKGAQSSKTHGGPAFDPEKQQMKTPFMIGSYLHTPNIVLTISSHLW
jgi:hypothetical protein